MTQSREQEMIDINIFLLVSHIYGTTILLWQYVHNGIMGYGKCKNIYGHTYGVDDIAHSMIMHSILTDFGK